MFKLSRTLCKVLSNIAERLFKVMDILPMLLVWFHYFVAFLFVFMYIKFILNLGKIFFFQPQENSARCKLIIAIPIHVKMEEHVLTMRTNFSAFAPWVSQCKFIVFSEQNKKMLLKYLSFIEEI